MFKHVLIATDGSELSRKAIHHGIGLARAIGADATAITVTIPFRVFALNPERIPGMEESYSNQMRRRNASPRWRMLRRRPASIAMLSALRMNIPTAPSSMPQRNIAAT